jgi:hypothetical protein
MKIRLLIALVIVLALFLGGGLAARASDDQPHCWYVSYTVTVMGHKIVKVPKTCVPCLGFCNAMWYSSAQGTEVGNVVSIDSGR